VRFRDSDGMVSPAQALGPDAGRVYLPIVVQ
jgi:hypothetical protein